MLFCSAISAQLKLYCCLRNLQNPKLLGVSNPWSPICTLCFLPTPNCPYIPAGLKCDVRIGGSNTYKVGDQEPCGKFEILKIPTEIGGPGNRRGMYCIDHLFCWEYFLHDYFINKVSLTTWDHVFAVPKSYNVNILDLEETAKSMGGEFGSKFWNMGRWALPCQYI